VSSIASVIIPTFRNELRLEWTLEALRLQTCGDFEVIVVDDGGSLTTERLVDRFVGKLRIAYEVLGGEKTDSRSGAARNLGAKRSIGDRLIFLDSDMVADPDLVESHTRNVAPNTALYGFRRHFPEDQVRPFPGWIDHSRLRAASRPDTRLAGYACWDGPRLYLHFLSCNYSLSADLFCSLGGHDERYVGWGEEDIDLGFRLSQAGYRIQPLWGRGQATHLDHPSRARGDRARPWFLNSNEPLCANGRPLSRRLRTETIELHIR